MLCLARVSLVSLLGFVFTSGCYNQPSSPGQGTAGDSADSTGTDGVVTATDSTPMTASTSMTTTTQGESTVSTSASSTDPTATSESTTSDPTDPTETTGETETGVVACGDGSVAAGEFCPPDAAEVFGVGNGASDVVLADIDGGRPDIITLDILTSTVSVLRNDDAGSFSAAESHAVTDGSCRIQAIDGDGDDDIDLAILGNGIVSLINDGDGGFSRNDSDVTSFGGCEDYHDLGVLNNNGGPIDVVFSGQYNNSFASGTNGGSGWAFAAPSDIGGPGEGSSGVTVTEFSSDADNIPDVVVLNQYYGEGQLFRGDGAGGFAAAGSYEACAGLGEGARFATTGDVDSDGQIDIVTTCMTGNFTLALGNPDGTFDAPVEILFAGAHRPLVADVNLDDYPDVQVSSSSLDRINVYLNDGAGGLAMPVQLDVGGPARSVDVGDLNGDGAADIVAAFTGGQGGGVAVFIGQP